MKGKNVYNKSVKAQIVEIAFALVHLKLHPRGVFLSFALL